MVSCQQRIEIFYKHLEGSFQFEQISLTLDENAMTSVRLGKDEEAAQRARTE
jgi:hypothetical protein